MKRHALKEPECHHVEDIFNCRVLCGLHYIKLLHYYKYLQE